MFWELLIPKPFCMHPKAGTLRRGEGAAGDPEAAEATRCRLLEAERQGGPAFTRGVPERQEGPGAVSVHFFGVNYFLVLHYFGVF